jgi:hypothetical protein
VLLLPLPAVFSELRDWLNPLLLAEGSAMQLDRALASQFDPFKQWMHTCMSALSDQITALQTQVTTTAAKVTSDLASLQSQLNTLSANAGNQFTASDLANLQSIQSQISAIDAAPVTAASTPAPAAVAPASTPSPSSE